jgi:hypothetical protein
VFQGLRLFLLSDHIASNLSLTLPRKESYIPGKLSTPRILLRFCDFGFLDTAISWSLKTW